MRGSGVRVSLSADLSVRIYCIYRKTRTPKSEAFSGVRADLRTAFMPDSEQMELTGTKYRKRHSVSVEQIQDSLPIGIFFLKE